MNRSDFQKVMEAVKEAYGDRFQKLTTSMLNVWYSCLDDLDGDRLLRAARNYIKEKQYPPTIADLREAYRDTRWTEPAEGKEEKDPFGRFQTMQEDVFEEFRRSGIIDDTGCIECLNATDDQIRILQECGAL